MYDENRNAKKKKKKKNIDTQTNVNTSKTNGMKKRKVNCGQRKEKLLT